VETASESDENNEMMEIPKITMGAHQTAWILKMDGSVMVGHQAAKTFV
jgi:hypothetical protein